MTRPDFREQTVRWDSASFAMTEDLKRTSEATPEFPKGFPWIGFTFLFIGYGHPLKIAKRPFGGNSRSTNEFLKFRHLVRG